MTDLIAVAEKDRQANRQVPDTGDDDIGYTYCSVNQQIATKNHCVIQGLITDR